MSTPARLPLTWNWLGEGKVPPNYKREAAHPEKARWAASPRPGEFAVCVESGRRAGQNSVYGPSWYSIAEAVNAAWISPPVSVLGADTPRDAK